MDRIQPLRIMAGHLSDVDVSILLSVFIGSYIFFLHFKIIIVIALFGSYFYLFEYVASKCASAYLSYKLCFLSFEPEMYGWFLCSACNGI